jgi:hypothetical protein
MPRNFEHIAKALAHHPGDAWKPPLQKRIESHRGAVRSTCASISFIADSSTPSIISSTAGVDLSFAKSAATILAPRHKLAWHLIEAAARIC